MNNLHKTFEAMTAGRPWQVNCGKEIAASFTPFMQGSTEAIEYRDTDW